MKPKMASFWLCKLTREQMLRAYIVEPVLEVIKRVCNSMLDRQKMVDPLAFLLMSEFEAHRRSDADLQTAEYR